MASNYKVNGTDLDSIFAAIGSSTPRSDTGYSVGAQDLAARYYASTGGDTIGYDTGYKVSGTDISNFFRSIGYSGGGGGGSGGDGPGGNGGQQPAL